MPGAVCKDVYSIVAKEIDNTGFSNLFPHIYHPHVGGSETKTNV